MRKRVVVGKKLLVASLGVAAISYVACTNVSTSGNLVAPPPSDAADDAKPDAPVTSGNLMPPPVDAEPPRDAQPDVPPTSGNLMPPPPPDAGDGGNALDADRD